MKVKLLVRSNSDSIIRSREIIMTNGFVRLISNFPKTKSTQVEITSETGMAKIYFAPSGCSFELKEYNDEYQS